MPTDLRPDNGAVMLHDRILLSELPDTASCLPDPEGAGVFLRCTAAEARARQVFPLGRLAGVRRFTALHRYEPFWMKAMTGTRGGEVRPETQYLLAETESGDCALLIPLISGPIRCCLRGTGEDGLELVAESGDPAVVTQEVVGLFLAAGPDPYALMEAAARSVNAWMGRGRLRREKPLPAFVDQFGWCTWDAFYQEVSQEKVRQGLEHFREGGVTPKLLILDDGWQSEHRMPSGEQRLTGFAANDKFPGDLGPTVRMAKDEFGVQTFLVWHALNGYWGGVDGDALPGYGVRPVARNFSPDILHYGDGVEKWWGPVVGVVAPEHVYRFFQDYHRHLRAQGVDGVKVDNQAALEGVAAGSGGRVTLMQRYHEALEGSAQTQFGGNLINCMSCANEMLYGALASTVTRTSTDFWPNDPASHGLHLYTNAQVSAWFGEFVHPDWDMFQSGHPMGTFHAAGRAVSGGPVYVSDKPGAHDFALLRKLVLPDGSVLRADAPGRPTRDCLFHNPLEHDALLKVFNRNGDAGVVGVFNAHPREVEKEPITGTVGPADVEGLRGEQFAVYAHYTRELRLLAPTDRWEITLSPLASEVFTLVPLHQGFAPIGLADMFNSAGAVVRVAFPSPGRCEVTLKGGGRFLAWSEAAPTHAETEDGPVPFTYAADTRALEATLPEGPATLRVFFGEEGS